MSRKSNQLKKRLAIEHAKLKAEVRRADSHAASAQRRERELVADLQDARTTIKDADATIQKLAKVRVGVRDLPMHTNDVSGLEIIVHNYELKSDPEGVCGHIARSAAEQIMEYAIKQGFVSKYRVAPLVEGPKRRDILDGMRYPYDRPFISNTGI